MCPRSHASPQSPSKPANSEQGAKKADLIFENSHLPELDSDPWVAHLACVRIDCASSINLTQLRLHLGKPDIKDDRLEMLLQNCCGNLMHMSLESASLRVSIAFS